MIFAFVLLDLLKVFVLLEFQFMPFFWGGTVVDDVTFLFFSRYGEQRQANHVPSAAR